MIPKKTSIKYSKNAFFGKTRKNFRKRIKVEFLKKDHNKKNIKQQSKLAFNGFLKTNSNCDSYRGIMIVWMDEPIYLGFTVIKLKKILMYET